MFFFVRVELDTRKVFIVFYSVGMIDGYILLMCIFSNIFIDWCIYI